MTIDRRGLVTREHSVRDLDFMKKFLEDVKNSKQLEEIPEHLLLKTFNGHSLFSMFKDNADVLQKIYQQLDEMDKPPSLDTFRVETENVFFRKLHKILILPQYDLKGVFDPEKVKSQTSE